ncbi:MAG: hypothetical protein WCD79_12295 [Chthoniobacteraceae bacterium]
MRADFAFESMFLQGVEGFVEIHGFILDGLPDFFSELVGTAVFVFFQMQFQTFQMPFDRPVFSVDGRFTLQFVDFVDVPIKMHRSLVADRKKSATNETGRSLFE